MSDGMNLRGLNGGQNMMGGWRVVWIGEWR